MGNVERSTQWSALHITEDASSASTSERADALRCMAIFQRHKRSLHWRAAEPYVQVAAVGSLDGEMMVKGTRTEASHLAASCRPSHVCQ